MSRNRQWIAVAAVVLVFGGSQPSYGQASGVFQLSQISPGAYQSAPAPSSFALRREFLPDEPAASSVPPSTIPAPAGSASIYDPRPWAPNDCMANCCAPPPIAIVALAESTFFWPSFSGVGVSNGFGVGGPGGAITNVSAAANPLFLVAPRITFGVQGSQWGVVGRFWDAQATTTGVADVDPIGYNVSQTFHAYTADLECVRRFAGRYGTLWGFGGFRYGSISYTQSYAATSITGSDFITSSGFANSRFNGSGFTFGSYGTHSIGGGPFSLFASNRYSFLFGGGRSTNKAQAAVLTPGGSDASTDCDCGRDNAQLFIAEVQLGMQWEHQLRWMPGRAFIRTAAEYQYWTTAGISHRGLTQTATNSGAIGVADTSAGNLLLNMVGFNIGAGIIY